MHRLHFHRSKILALGALFSLLLALLVTSQIISAQEGDGAAEPLPPTAGSPIHPTFPLLDGEGNNVLDTGNPVSTMATCGACHDTAFIADHSFHADVGLAELTGAGDVAGGRVWDISPGLFGKWNPLTYRYLSPEGDAHVDLTTPAWLMTVGLRHAGGGPAVLSRSGVPLTSLLPDAANPEASIVDPDSGELVAWDWQTSGVVEMNCFLCHTPSPDNEARRAALAAGNFGWANTATLHGLGIVAASGAGWTYQPEAFDEQGAVRQEVIALQDPTNANCGQCHGEVHVDTQTPLVLDDCDSAAWSTLTTGQVFSPQRLSQSGLNLEGKSTLARSWDIHAERVVNCTDCHYSLNNPVYYQEAEETRPDHLLFDPRRVELGDYLLRPLHQFAKGQGAQSTLAPELDNTLRRCESCHSIEATHDWLPYKERHTSVLSCESCHVPHLYAPARESVNWTALRPDGQPLTTCRGVAEGGGDTPLISGFDPVLLLRDNGDGTTSLAPHNLISSWYWVYGDPARPVALRDLQAAWFADDDAYAPAILEIFDGNGDGTLSEDELLIDSTVKEEVITARLEGLGLEAPRIAGEVQPYSINHDVAHGDWATRECSTCHGNSSRITEPMLLAGSAPGGVLPVLVSAPETTLRGELVREESGALLYRPQTAAEKESGLASLYILGHNSVELIDWFGVIVFLGTLAGTVIHGGLRFFAARRYKPLDAELREVYMYGVYERLWHWLQTLVIFGLIFTGLVIHKPDKFGMFSFRYVVEVHNVLAAILLINAALAAFYHLASGEIQQFLPRPRGFFDQTFEQAKYYLRGIFRGEEHPFEKTRERKLNPLQQITYFGLLNVLLPLQVITGTLMWGLQRWPEIARSLGGLPFFAPLHTLVAWMLASFIVMHVYLTTTGHTATANIRAMIMGWDEVEVHGQDVQTQPTEV